MKKLYVEEMSCGHCVSRIGGLLTEMNVEFEVDLDKKMVFVNVDDEMLKTVVSELDDIGFTGVEK